MAPQQHTCGRCGLTDDSVLDLDTGGAYHPELFHCITKLRQRYEPIREQQERFTQLSGTYALFPSGLVKGPMDGTGEVEELAWAMNLKLKAVRIGVLTEEPRTEVTRIESEILTLCRSLGYTYVNRMNDAVTRMNERSLRVLCEQLVKAFNASLGIPLPVHRDAER